MISAGDACLRARYAPWMVSSPFGVSWDALDLDDLRRFFAEAEDEGLTWEAKGTHIRPDHIRRSASAFGNGILTGYLVLGASRPDAKSSWALRGWTFPDEPATWVTNTLINGGVDPLPAYDVRSFVVSATEHVAAIRFFPVAVPPVITNQGQVWERLSSVSRMVTDSGALRHLVERGNGARIRAVDAATRAMGTFETTVVERPYQVIAAAASASLREDNSALVFSPGYYNSVANVLTQSLLPPVYAGIRSLETAHAISQDWILLSNAGFHHTEGYAVRVDRHGAVAIGQAGINDSGLRTVATEPASIRPILEAATELAVRIGPAAPVFVSVLVTDERQGNKVIQRWWDSHGPTDDDITSLAREARRALGQREFEPDPS